MKKTTDDFPDTPSVTKISRLIDSVAGCTPVGCFNPWNDTCPTEHGAGAVARRRRLHSHLSCPAPALVLVGEAAGYQGCRYSGIPFTSERLLLEGCIPRVSPLERRITNRPRPWSEPSATVLWGTLHALGLADRTVLWNAVPWHPEGPRGPHSNRSPTAAEREAGLPFLRAFLALYPAARVFAVGAVAAGALDRLGVAHIRLRHPAYGGATRFRAGLAAAMER